jgi:hypothetical protein
MTAKRTLLGITAALCSLTAGAGDAQADFRDGPIFADTAAHGRLDLGPLYVFRSPANANNTVFILTVSPFTDALTPATFVKGARYDIAIDTTGDGVEDMVLRTTFGPPSRRDGSQSVLTRCLPKPRCRRYILVRGRTGQNIPVRGGGAFRAANQDIPEFFDQGAWENPSSLFPRAPGLAHNFFGPKANSLAIVLELPSSRIPPVAANPNHVIGAWTRITAANGGRRDREGRPFINTGLIPQVPHGSVAPDLRNAFNAALPKNDRSATAGFRAAMISVMTDPAGLYKRSMADANFLADALLPDLLMFQIGNPNGFGTTIGPGPGFFTGPFPGGQVLGNGRRLHDDVHDILLNLLTNGAIPSDNVGDDNGLGITDGSVDPVSGKTRAIAFPYLAPPDTLGPNP